jgi:hypothetical protein
LWEKKKDLGIDGRIISKWIIQHIGRIMTGFFWVRIGTRGEVL